MRRDMSSITRRRQSYWARVIAPSRYRLWSLSSSRFLYSSRSYRAFLRARSRASHCAAMVAFRIVCFLCVAFTGESALLGLLFPEIFLRLHDRARDVRRGNLALALPPASGRVLLLSIAAASRKVRPLPFQFCNTFRMVTCGFPFRLRRTICRHAKSPRPFGQGI